MKTKNFLLSTAAMAAGLIVSSGVMAQSTATGNLNAKIVITSNCAIVGTGTDLDFASHVSTETSAASASNGGFSVSCTPGTTYKIGLQSSAGSSTTDGKGLLKSADSAVTQTIGYQLYQDASFATVWGNSPTTSPNIQAGTGTGAAQLYTVYGKTTSTLNVPASTYSDIVNISVYY
ncbi:Csu type fimbrial protein [Eoetvoesiella caeni]|uniref:Spore coat protein U-like protein n=1 Tax=Eoetvoesiella caeni TaxID=645616 RepID=A0A366H9M6_9BURK|nr:spore coat U domain-containing protein [Eoetvoesiella caeni]MCI2809593.1 spore coat U domain-containing protein [Eoetvoesiella caeni]NYT56089.1 spore coat protein U domain-containing protein [Eoetvoesiella caeni]RBP38854.1 spore coat protein U-like protein [Eoetvoesiella caeni]